MRPTTLCVVAVLAPAVAAGSPRLATASEGDRAASVSVSYATFNLGDLNPHGALLGFDYEQGFSDVLVFRASAGGAAYDEDGLAFSAHAAVGINYIFDVLKFVPYMNLGLGLVVVGGESVDEKLKPVVQLGVGVDILRNRERSWGVLLRLESFASDLTVFTAGIRTTWRWGFF